MARKGQEIAVMQDIPSITELSGAVIKQVTDGAIEPIEVYSRLSRLKKTIEIILDNPEVKSATLGQLAQDGGKRDWNNVEMSEVETGVKYDYSVCGSYRWNEIQEQIKMLAKERTELETMLKNVNENVADTFTGEILHRPNKTFKKSIKVIVRD